MNIHAADLFCGAGGTTTGLLQTCDAMRHPACLTAVNHWNLAIDTHTLNHPQVRHINDSLEAIDPRQAIPGGKLHLLVGSPECTHHSRARGGKPRCNQSRATANYIHTWAERLKVDGLLLENVREWQDWGPLNADGKPSKRGKGRFFTAFMEGLEQRGFRLEHKVVNCADHGDPTTRERLFVIGLNERFGRAPRWPDASHGKTTATPWNPARDIIDWSLKGESIFTRRKPLAPNTLRRIEAGLRKFAGLSFVLPLEGYFRGNRPRSLNDPLPTITSRGGGAFVEPYIVQFDQTGGAGGVKGGIRSVSQPIGTLVTKANLALIEPQLVHLRGTHASQLKSSARSLDDPTPTLTTSGAHLGLVEFLMHATHHGAHRGELALIEAMVLGQQSCAAARPVSHPVPTVSTAGAISLFEPCLVKYYGTGAATGVGDPLDTVTTKDRFGLVEGVLMPALWIGGGRYILDILFRMLQPHELAAAMSFPPGYRFAGNREQQVKQIGNAVPVRTAAALCRAQLEHILSL